MAITSYQAQRLAEDTTFLRRVRNALAKSAFVVLDESTATTSHADRAAYARKVLASLEAYAAQIAKSLVTRSVIDSSTVSYDYDIGAIVTDATDANIKTAIDGDWNKYAGVE